jgi:hypothetical protein
VRPQSTAIGDAVAGVKAMWVAANPDVELVDGPPLTDGAGQLVLEDESFIVGFGDPAFVLERSDPDYGGRVTETGEIVCVVSLYTGDEAAMAATRARAVAILANFERVLREDPTMGGRVDDSILGRNMQWSQSQGPEGLICACAFSVRYEAHI